MTTLAQVQAPATSTGEETEAAAEAAAQLSEVEIAENARQALELLDNARVAVERQAPALAQHVEGHANVVANKIVSAQPTSQVLTDILLHSDNGKDMVSRTEALLHARAENATGLVYRFQDWLVDYSLRAIGALMTLIIGWLIAKWLSQRVRKWLQRANRIDPTVVNYIETLIRTVVLMVTIIAVLGKFGVQTASFVGVLSAASLAIGLALQGTLSNFAAGVMLLIFRPFREGDEVEIATQSGTVSAIGVFATEVTDYSGEYILIPNGEVWGKTIRNLTRNGRRRFEIVVELAHSNDVEDAMARLQRVLEEHDEVLDSPGPLVQVIDIGVASFKIRGRGWGDARITNSIRSRVLIKLKKEFEDAKITFPANEVVLMGSAARLLTDTEASKDRV